MEPAEAAIVKADCVFCPRHIRLNSIPQSEATDAESKAKTTPGRPHISGVPSQKSTRISIIMPTIKTAADARRRLSKRDSEDKDSGQCGDFNFSRLWQKLLVEFSSCRTQRA
jgi:hypothetical protein